MSERKTTEVKLRVTPEEKTSWQIAAEKENIGLSEFARRAMNDRAQQIRGHACPDCGEALPPHTSHAGTCVYTPKSWTFEAHKRD